MLVSLYTVKSIVLELL